MTLLLLLPFLLLQRFGGGRSAPEEGGGRGELACRQREEGSVLQPARTCKRRPGLGVRVSGFGFRGLGGVQGVGVG